jgi:hypothetical protein
VSVVLSRQPDALARCRQLEPGAEIALLVLAADGHSVTGVDVRSGALARAWTAVPVDARLRPYDVVTGTLDTDADLVPDPAQPEALVVAGPLEPSGRITGKRAERYLRPLLHPPGQHLLGVPGPEVLFWERTSDHPSAALVEPETPTVVVRRRRSLWCRFGWRAVRMELPVIDRWMAAALARRAQTRLVAGPGERLVVALTPPIEGRCHKVVAAILPRP